ncbi:hypothetical protein EIN_019010 [Entamoeba invadens IP1]|uniref:hypothetical protein n=1 Tax=Entamoeba invadens IP1 TaxID=370355 RepID=UPI0002C3DDC0|nr:hypothetical protein EIN_019010 [Entamoeba invadens IP1]ELP90532.1 hypothetical protein EIN_019010 [Entamoeba invadens IP1]|eukprot:XP_004257303.1 hypothetical protein EIN_019010 [Entamoeba invadens IP1]
MSVITTVSYKFPSFSGLDFRFLELGDYQKGFTHLLAELTSCQMTEDEFKTFFEEMRVINRHLVVVAEDPKTTKIVACATLLVERKFIHCGGLVGHIEDVAVSINYRGRGIGKSLITCLEDLARATKCYKIVLDCSNTVKGFYEKCGIQFKDNCMAVYL